MKSFTVDPDIRHAETPPGWLYSDPEVFARVKEAIFARSWQLVGDLDRIKAPGSVLPVAFLDGLLPEPLLLTRDDQDRVHCLSNVCTHRANLVVEGEAVLPALRCRYHGRRFGLDGRFLSMPEFDDAVGFPRANEGLPSVETGAWGPFLFAALSPATPFARWIDPLVSRVDGYDATAAVFDAARSRDYLVNANWALYVDNYLEGFHVPFVHAWRCDRTVRGVAVSTQAETTAPRHPQTARDSAGGREQSSGRISVGHSADRGRRPRSESVSGDRPGHDRARGRVRMQSRRSTRHQYAPGGRWRLRALRSAPERPRRSTSRC